MIVRGRYISRRPGCPRGSRSEEAGESIERIENANDAARVQPRKASYFNAVQVFSYSSGALYQIYEAPGQITDIALEPDEPLIGSDRFRRAIPCGRCSVTPKAAAMRPAALQIMIKPTRPSIEINLVINTDRRT